jgi:hypothetical protein
VDKRGGVADASPTTSSRGLRLRSMFVIAQGHLALRDRAIGPKRAGHAQRGLRVSGLCAAQWTEIHRGADLSKRTARTSGKCSTKMDDARRMTDRQPHRVRR